MRQINDQVEEKDSQLNQFMQALQINQLHLDNFDYLKLPKQLLECCASLSVRRSLLTDEIPKAMKSIVDVSVQTKETLQDIEEAIEAEEKEHREERAANGADLSEDDSLSDESSEEEEEDRSKEPRKAKLRQICKRYDGLQKSFVDANASNSSLHEAFSVISKNLQILSMPLAELTEKLPAIEPVDGENSKEIREKLVALLGKVDEMKSQREELLRRFQRAVHEDDLTKRIASHQNEIAEPQSFFREQLKKHEQLMTYLQQNLQAQDNILRALADANALFTTDRQKILEATQQRNAFIDSLVFSYQSLSELFEKSRKGVAFFENLNKSLETLLKEAHEFCNKSREEREARQRLMQRLSTGQQGNYLSTNAMTGPTSAPVGPVFARQINRPAHNKPEQQPQSSFDEFSSSDRPKLKDFLPHMKPDSWGNGPPKAPSNTRAVGPPQVDRTGFAPTAADAAFHPNQLPNPQQQNQMPQAPQNSQQVRPNFQPGMNQPSPRKQGPVGPPQLQNPASFQQPFLGQPQFQPQHQHPPLAVPQHQPRQQQHQPQANPVLDQKQQLLDQKLFEQQQKERDIQLMKQQLEQQEQQLKYQQQQFMLHQEQQQQYLKMLEQEKDMRQQHQQPAVQPSNQYQATKQAVPNTNSQYNNSNHQQQQQQPQQPFQNHPNQYSGPSNNNPVARMTSQLSQQAFGPGASQFSQHPQLQPMPQQLANQMSKNMNGAVKPPEPQKPTGLPTLQPAVSSQAFKPDSVYRPGTLSSNSTLVTV